MIVKIRNSYYVRKDHDVVVDLKDLESYIKTSAPFEYVYSLEDSIEEYILDNTNFEFCPEDNEEDLDYSSIRRYITNIDELVDKFSCFVENYDDNN
jgi:hypothetical protein